MSDSAHPQAFRARAGIRYGLAFALVAALLLLQPLCTSTYLMLFYEKGGELIQPLPPEGMPIPRTLAWSPATVNFIHRLGPMPLAGVLGWNVALFCLLIYGLLRILNPSFRMTTGVDWDKTLLSRTYMHTQPLIKAFLILITGFLPAFFLWHLLGMLFGERSWVMAVRLALVGAAAWALFSQNGVAGDYESGNYETPRGPVMRSLLLRGAAAGLLAWLTLLYGPAGVSDYFFGFYRTLGGIGETQWWSILGLSLLFVGMLAFAWGGILVALGTPGWQGASRWRRGGAYVALLVGIFLVWNRLLPAHLATRYDYTPLSRVSAPELLARAAALPRNAARPQQVVAMAGRWARVASFTGRSTADVNASPEDRPAIEEFLKRRGYASALALPAYVTLTDGEALQWSSEGILRVALLNLEHGADPRYLRDFLEKLAVCAATPETIELVDRFANDRFAVYPDRLARVQMGDIFARLGRKERAEDFYRKASLPPGQVVARAEEHTMFVEGQVRGRILWNGRPVPGLKVGVVPLPAVPKLAELTDLKGETSPFWLWWVAASARTDPTGAFELGHLVAGDYILVVEAPPTHRITRQDIAVQGAPDRIRLSFADKVRYVGEIRITTEPPPATQMLAPQTSP